MNNFNNSMTYGLIMTISLGIMLGVLLVLLLTKLPEVILTGLVCYSAGFLTSLALSN